MIWSVNDEALNSTPSSISATMVRSASLGVGVNSFNLFISGGRLVWKSPNPYIFSLSAGGAVSSVSVLMNRAPHSGTLISNPNSGVVLETVFRLSVSGWLDEEGDLPLMYEFFSMSNGKNVLKRRSEIFFVESMLPAGSSSNHFLLSCWVGVYDSFGATTSSSVQVVVHLHSSSSFTFSLLSEISTALLPTSSNSSASTGFDSSSTAFLERKLQGVALLSSILNWKDCSMVPTACPDLNRKDCSYTRNTCGPCLSGYWGVTGDDNSLCVEDSIDENSVSDSLISCDSDSICRSWEGCVSGMCLMKSKSCPADCSGHGKCQLVNSESEDIVSRCGLFDSSCRTICFCDSDYSGDECGISITEMSGLREIRSRMVSGLLDVASNDIDANEGGVLSLLTSLSSVTRSPSELSLDSSGSALKVLSKALSQASLLQVSYNALWLDVMDSLDSVALIQSRDASQFFFDPSSTIELLNLLDNCTDFVAGQLVTGQGPVDVVRKMFRTRIQQLSFNSESVFLSSSSPATNFYLPNTFPTVFSSIPQLTTEIMSKTPSTFFSLTTSAPMTLQDQGDVKVSSLSLASTLVKSSLVDISSFSSSPVSKSNSISTSLSTFMVTESTQQLTSNMLRLKMLGSGSSSISRIVAVLPTLRSQSYPVYESVESVNTTCLSNDFRETVHVCRGVLGDVEITHRCDGTPGVIVSQCPRQSLQASCSTRKSSYYSCSVLNYTSISVTCVCEGGSDSGGRSLSILSDSGVLEVGVIIEKL